MTIYNGAQSFWIDQNLVQGATTVFVSAIELFFKSKPTAVNNSSGLTAPGVSIFIVDTEAGLPVIDPTKVYEVAHVSHPEIGISSDASDSTLFRFDKPVPIPTGKPCAFVLRFDQGAAFDLWKNKEGEFLVGTTTITPGATGTNSGRYFSFVASANQASQGGVTQVDEWRSQNDTDLKYRLYLARFAQNNVPVGANVDLVANLQVRSFTSQGVGVSFANGEYLIPPERLELLSFDQALSTKEAFVGAQLAYQDTFAWPGGYFGGNTAQKISVTQGNTLVTANTLLPNGASFTWTTVFNDYSGDKWLVIKTNDRVNVRKVTSILSNTQLQVDEPITFTNSLAHFLLTPVGRIDQFHKSSPFGINESFVILTNSSANSTLRFVNSTIETISISAGGSGYSNSDKLYVIGWENVSGKVTGGYRAQANLVTNSTGGVTAVYLSNSGAGFSNTLAAQIVIANSSSSNTTSNTSAGSGASFTLSEGATVRTELRPNNALRGVTVENLPISDILPFFEVDVTGNTQFNLSLDTRYARVEDANTLSGYFYYIDNTPANGFFQLEMFRRNTLTYSEIPTLVSRSNEFVTLYANGSPNDLVNTAYSTQVMLHMNITSNNDFNQVFINTQPIALFSKYLINNSYVGEETDRGEAWAKGLTKRISLQKTAEDLLVFLTAYKPANTDIQVYARLHNAQDPEAIDDKEWTRLELKNGSRLVSATADPQDYIELSYGFQPYPNIEFVANGVAFATNASSNLAGQGTNWNNVFVTGDLIRIYPTLFPNTSLVAVVNSVTNSSQIVINTPITNNSFLGTSLSIDKIEFPNQGFNNIMNDNVVRYYNTTMSEFDGFNSVQVKLVLLSDTPNRIPRIDDIQGIMASP